ncbi:MAG TPA: DEAD/DEAH box helicase, partial [Micromonosporaceae bacterium]
MSAATVSAGPPPGRPHPAAPAPVAGVLAQLRVRAAGPDPVTHIEAVPARAGETRQWPRWAPEPLRAAFAARGVTTPWRHQVEAAELAYGGEHVVVATGTGSGKSLAYQLPALARLLADPRATVLYLAPTKALAADQLRALAELGLDGVRPSCYDGDTPRAEREWIRQHSRFVLTNPDMLHHSILPGHARWSGFLRRLAFVVVDECHAYRGVFGSHVAHVLRRLRRQCDRYRPIPYQALAGQRAAPEPDGAGPPGTTRLAPGTADAAPAPTFVLASATS